MTVCRTFKILSLSIAAGILLSAPAAQAERADPASAIRGCTAAESTELERSLYSSGEGYENEEYDSVIMRIGLSYGDSAAAEAVFENLSGGGFYIGSYKDDRSFRETDFFNADSITVRLVSPGGAWRILPLEPVQPSDDIETVLININGEEHILFGSYKSKSETDRAIKESGAEAEAYFDGSGHIEVYETATSRLLFKTEDGTAELSFIPAAPENLTQYMGGSYQGGFKCSMHDSVHMNVINYVGLEDYVKGVIPYEMSSSWPEEALKAQAVCARTYGVYNQGRFEFYGCDLTADTYSQVYRGTAEANAVTDSAVDDTAGQLVWYKGQVCEIYYCSSNGGATEDGSNVFDTDAVYLSGKLDPFEQALDFPLKTWEVRLSPESASAKLREKGYEIGSISELKPEYSDTGNVICINFYDKDENCLEIRGRSCYTSLGLNSCRFKVSRDGDNFVFSGRGWGHSCGMSQWGANAMASVYGYNYEDILRFYFSGAYVL